MITAEEQAANSIQWIDRLPNYKKTTGQLRAYNENRYCCLGVGCRVMKIEPTNWNGSFEPRLVDLFGLTRFAGSCIFAVSKKHN